MKIWTNEAIPQDFKNSAMITIYKKTDLSVEMNEESLYS